MSFSELLLKDYTLCHKNNCKYKYRSNTSFRASE